MASAARLEGPLALAVERGELPPGSDVHALALALQNLMVGINAFAMALRDEDELWLTAKTTLEGLRPYRETRAWAVPLRNPAPHGPPPLTFSLRVP